MTRTSSRRVVPADAVATVAEVLIRLKVRRPYREDGHVHLRFVMDRCRGDRFQTRDI